MLGRNSLHTGCKGRAVPFSYATRPPGLICLAYTPPYPTDKFFSLPCYFEIRQNGAWTWNVWMELAMHFDLARYSRLWAGWGCGTSWLAPSEITSVLLLMKVSPQMDQRRILPVWVETTNPGASSLLKSWSVLPSPLRSFWSGFPGLWSGFVFLGKYTSLDVSYHWGNISISHLTNDKLLGYGLYFPPSLIELEGKAILWWDALWWSHLSIRRSPGARKTQNKIKQIKPAKPGISQWPPTCGNVLFFLMQLSINLVPSRFFFPKQRQQIFLEKRDKATGSNAGLAASPLINIFEPLLVILFLVANGLLGFQRRWDEELGSQRGLADLRLQSELALQQVELLFDVVVELVLVPHSLVENLHGLGGGDSFPHGHSHVSKFPVLCKRTEVHMSNRLWCFSLKGIMVRPCVTCVILAAPKETQQTRNRREMHFQQYLIRFHHILGISINVSGRNIN